MALPHQLSCPNLACHSVQIPMSKLLLST
uniref:Uncharacterized protein n=1 Tax=Arundo donax TaxID=35708 RepID=A0A0A8YUR1_ARUDO